MTANPAPSMTGAALIEGETSKFIYLTFSGALRMADETDAAALTFQPHPAHKGFARVPVFPLGKPPMNDDRRFTCSMERAALVKDNFLKRKSPLPLNYKHNNDVAKGAKAAGRLCRLDIKGDLVTALCSVTATARKEIEEGEWTGSSAAFAYDTDKDGNLSPIYLVHLSLTNEPAIDGMPEVQLLEAELGRAKQRKETPMNPAALVGAICSELGLPEDCSPEQVLLALGKRLGSGGEPAVTEPTETEEPMPEAEPGPEEESLGLGVGEKKGVMTNCGPKKKMSDESAATGEAVRLELFIADGRKAMKITDANEAIFRTAFERDPKQAAALLEQTRSVAPPSGRVSSTAVPSQRTAGAASYRDADEFLRDVATFASDNFCSLSEAYHHVATRAGLKAEGVTQ